MHHRSALAFALASLLVAIGMATPVHATIFPAKGGRGDAAEEYRCPSGTVLVGFAGRSGNWIDQIGLMCSQVLANYATGNAVSLPPKGGNGGSPNAMYCERDAAVRSIKIGLDSDADYNLRHVYAIAFSCMRPKDGTPAQGYVFGHTFVGDDVPNANDIQTCPGSEYATGLNIRYGRHVNAVGLICGAIEPPHIQVIIPPNPGGSQPAPAPSQPGSLMAGTFDTDFGILALAGSEGTYSTLNGRMTITEVHGDTALGIWSTSWSAHRCPDGGYHGTFHFNFTKSGFTGIYAFCAGEIAGQWNGKRLSPL